MKFSLTLLFGSLLLWSSCFNKTEEPKGNQTSQGSVLVLNEGNFQWGNASIRSFNLATNSYESDDLFKTANGRRLGDVLQSASRINNSFWLVVNNSRKIEVVNPSDFKSIMTINDLLSPRFACDLGNGEVAVSDLYSDSISFIDAASGSIHSRMYLKGWTEQMVAQGNDLWISNQQSSKIYQVDIQQKTVIDSLDIGFGSFSMYKDNDKHIWIATKGNKDLNIPSMIHCLNPKTKTFLFSEALGESAVQDFFVSSQNQVYYIYQNKLYHFNTISNSLPQNPFYQGTAGILYAVEAYDGKVFLCDAVDYVQDGLVTVLNGDGEILHRFQAGRIPNGFLFIP